MNDKLDNDPRLYAIPDIHGHAKGEHKAYSDERPIPLSARMLFLWFYHACRRGWPRFLMVTDHMNYLTFEDPAAINLVRRALKLAQAGDLYGAAETASVDVGHASVVSDGLRRGMRYSIGAEVDNDPRSRPDAQNIVDAMKPDGMIRSVHFLTIDHPTHGPNWNWPFDNPEFTGVYDVVGTEKTWELYMATLLDAIERLPGDIVGHFYVPALFGHWPDDATLDGYENALVDACEARGMAIEFNTRFLYRNHSAEQKANYLRAYRRLLAKCKAKNVGVAVGSDAHSPKDQGGAFATVLAVLDECEINELVFPLAGRLARVALRVERKIEPPPELPPATPPEERKSARKARPLETPIREVTSVAVAADDTAPDAPKAKPRPKRGKVKSATSTEFIPVHSESEDGTLAAAIDSGAEPTSPNADDDAEAAALEITHITASESHSGVTETHWVMATDAAPVTDSLSEADPVAVTGPTGETVLPAATDSAPVADSIPVAVSVTVTDSVTATDSASQADSVVATDATAEPDRVTLIDAAAPTHATVEPDVVTVIDSVSPTHSAAEPEILTEIDAVAVTDDSAHTPAAENPLVAEFVDSVPESHSPVASGPLVVAEPVVSEAIGEMVSEADLEPIVSGAGDEVPIPGEPDVGAIVIETAVKEDLSWTDVGDEALPSESQVDSTKAAQAKSKPAPKKAAKPAVKSAAKKVAPKKAPAKKAAVLKTSAKKAAPKKAAAKKAPAKKAAVRVPGAKKAATKKAAAKKANPKKPAQRRR